MEKRIVPLAGNSKYIAFVDECGDHSMEKIDRDFPIFVLATVVIERTCYIEKIVPAITKLKLSYWDHEGVNLHSRDIRKSEGPFAFLRDLDKREKFMATLTSLMKSLPYTLFLTGIRKDLHRKQYGQNAANPYTLALTFTLERIISFLEGNGETTLPVLAEARGKNEDQSLEAEFYKIRANGTDYIAANRFERLGRLLFANKRNNIAGVQLADLCAYPSARHILDPSKLNEPFKIVKPHIYMNNGVSGWKVFPELIKENGRPRKQDRPPTRYPSPYTE
jgi:hypothetical protein